MERGEHPLLNPLIMQQVFGFFASSASTEDFQACRLVSKVWSSESLPHWRKHAVIAISSNTKNLHGISLANFLSELANLNSPHQLIRFPFRKYKLRDFEIDLAPEAKLDTDSTKFWQTFGPLLTQLILQNTNFGKYTNKKSALIQFLVDHTPNLKTLKVLESQGIAFLRDDNENPVTHPNITELHMEHGQFPLSYFPNLETIQLAKDRADQIVDPELNPDSLRKITKIDVMECQIPLTFHLGRPPFPHYANLMHLSIGKDNNILFVEEFPRLHSATLESLHVFCVVLPNRIPPRPLQVKYPLLTQLRLWGNVNSDLSFLRLTPNLRLLHMDLYGYEMAGKMKGSLPTGNGVSKMFYDEWIITRAAGLLEDFVLPSLEYCQINCKISPENIAHLAKWMPNLKSFKSVLHSPSLSKVSEAWPGLENLECYFGSYLWDEDLFPDMYWESKGSKGIDNLKALKSFSFYCQCGASELTDKIVTNLLEMRNLTDLQICVSDMFSKEAEMVLKDGINRVKILRNYSGNPSHNQWDCCRWTEHKWAILKFISH